MELKILIITNILDHPLTSRIHFLIDFLERKQINSRVLDISFYHKNQHILTFLKNILLFPTRAYNSSERIVRLPPSPIIGTDKSQIRPFMHFLYSLFILLFVKLIYRFNDYSVIVSADPFSALAAFFGKKSNTVTVYEDLDYFEDLYSGIWRIPISFLEKFALKNANLVISVSKPLLRRAKQLNPESILISNGVNLQSFSTPTQKSRKNFIVYAGSMDEWAGLSLVIKAFPLIRQKIPWIKLKLIGDGKEKHALEMLAKKLSLEDCIFFIGKLPYDQMADLLCDCYIGIAMFKPCKAAAFSSPLKLFDYMAAGLPIIATDIGDIGRILRKSKSGIAINWNVSDFVSAVELLLTEQNLWNTLHKNSLLYVKNYDWNTLFNIWLEEIEARNK